MIRFTQDILDVKNVLGAKRNNDVITLRTTTANPFLFQVTCTGSISVETSIAGQTHITNYSDLSSSYISLQADANTDVIIRGAVTYLRPHNYNTENHNWTKLIANTKSLDFLLVYNCKDLLDIDIKKAPNLTRLEADYIYNLTSIDVTQNTKLQRLELGYDSGLAELDISNNPEITTLNVFRCSSMRTIKARALASAPANNIASLITANSGLAGTVYLNPLDTYYNTIATAATNAGWTIGEL